MKAKAYSYIRFSSPDQARGDSYRRQREAAELYCETSGLEFVSSKEYLFFDSGRSAYTAKHLDDTGELRRFLTYVERGDIAEGSYLIVESLDRLSREKVKDALPRFLDLLNKNINIYTSADQKLYTKDVNEIDLIVSIVQMSRAHSESSLKGQRVSKAWSQKQKLAREELKPLGATCPYWITYNAGAYEVIPERVKVIEMIFEMNNNGHGQRQIAKYLNAHMIPIFGSLKRNVSGQWGSSSVGKILGNRAVLGEYQPTRLVSGERKAVDEPVLGFFPAIISDSVFYSAKVARSIRKVSGATKQTKTFNIWQGIAKCMICGQPMHLVNKGKPPKGYKYLRCYGAAKGACESKLIQLNVTEQAFKQILAKLDSLSLVQESQAQSLREINILNEKENEISKRLSELEGQILSLGADLPKTLVQIMMQLEYERSQIAQQKASAKSEFHYGAKISKKEFLERLDLSSYAGRADANQFLKTLGVTVKLEIDKYSTNYDVVLDGKCILTVAQEGDKFHYSTEDKASLQRIYEHGDEGVSTFLSETLIGLLEYEASLLSKYEDKRNPE